MNDADTEEVRAQQAIGVQRLLDRLRDEGVEAGRQEGEALRRRAQEEATSILEEARADAARTVEEARQKAAQLQAAGEEALRTATRDTVLRFSEEIMEHLRNRVERLVSEEVFDRELFRQLVVQVMQRALDVTAVREAAHLRIELPLEPLGVEELKNDPDALQDGLSQLAKQLAGSTWREGVSFGALDSGDGVRVVAKDEGLEIDLSPEAVTELLLRHLQPRFRALMRGIIQ
ncbi:MAG: hypothetical protein AAGD10_02580 [Myxococcota bacterium]